MPSASENAEALSQAVHEKNQQSVQGVEIKSGQSIGQPEQNGNDKQR